MSGTIDMVNDIPIETFLALPKERRDEKLAAMTPMQQHLFRIRLTSFSKERVDRMREKIQQRSKTYRDPMPIDKGYVFGARTPRETAARLLEQCGRQVPVMAARYSRDGDGAKGALALLACYAEYAGTVEKLGDMEEVHQYLESIGFSQPNITDLKKS
jgi:predicted house-cleaning noncanonical NTP pyrophosphatase (MazG superfamily)